MAIKRQHFSDSQQLRPSLTGMALVGWDPGRSRAVCDQASHAVTSRLMLAIVREIMHCTICACESSVLASAPWRTARDESQNSLSETQRNYRRPQYLALQLKRLRLTRCEPQSRQRASIRCGILLSEHAAWLEGPECSDGHPAALRNAMQAQASRQIGTTELVPSALTK